MYNICMDGKNMNYAVLQCYAYTFLFCIIKMLRLFSWMSTITLRYGLY